MKFISKARKKKLAVYCGFLGLGTAMMSFGKPDTLVFGIGNGLQLATFIYGIGYFTLNFFRSIPKIDNRDRLNKNTQRIYELEKEVGIRDE